MTDASILADHFTASDRMVIFTGAGISTESGIPDFRSPGGVWSKMKPIYFQDFVADREKRREGWNRVFNRTAGWTGAAPNQGHHAVARLVEMGKATSVITQNVDNLHQDGGAPDDKVIEIHGNASYAKCLNCGKRHAYEDLRPRWEADEDLTCDFCGGLLKSGTISFGQAMPEDKMMRAEAEALSCDLMVAIGSSLVVYPAANIPIIAKQNGAKYIIINRDATEHDPYADLVLNTEIGPLLTEALERISG